MSQTPLLVAQAPSARHPRGSPGGPLSGDAGRRLARALGVDHALLMACERVNLLDRHPGKQGRGDRLPASLACFRALLLAPRLAGRDVLFVGLGVARAFGHGARPILEPFDVPWLPTGHRAVVVPHPSGVNPWWNTPENRTRARLVLRPLVLGQTLTPRAQRVAKR